MKNKILGTIVFTIVISAFSVTPFAQQKITDTLPAYQDFVLDVQPDGFVHAHEQGFLNRFIIEYIPKGESLESWTRILVIVGLGPAKSLPDIDSYAARMFHAIRGNCETMDVSELSSTEGDARFRVACDPVAAGVSIPGGQDLQWEIGIYRFVRTDEALYQIHYLEHGTEAPSRTKREKVYADAADAVDKVLVCQLNGPNACPPLDEYVLGTEPQPVTGEPPCRSNDAVPCNPAAIFSAPAAAALPTDESAKKALLTLDFSKVDLSATETLRHYANIIIKSLSEGHPEVTLVIRGPSPNYAVTAEDRVRVGTFLQVLRSFLVNQRVVDPNALQINFLNFR